ncbi:response regulator transcription factor [Lachnospiraceae bacterium C1.1]|nr:response regulator transcription factor [Lachnospiraceae bacterium C1.1]
MFRILVVEDDRSLNKMICSKLKREEYITFSAYDGEEAIEVMDREHIDLIVTDIMMPKMNGYELIKLLRSTSYFLPVLIITAKDQIEDMEKAFSAGTDDYMIKPINLKEMVLRIRALLRRAQLENEKKIIIGNTELDYKALTMTSDNITEELPPKEFYLLFKLLNNPGKIFTRTELLEEIWGADSDSDERNVDAHIKKIRKRISEKSGFDIETVRGLGYKAVLKTENNNGKK